MAWGSLSSTRASSQAAVKRKVLALKRLEAARAVHITAEPSHSRSSPSRPSRLSRAKTERHVLTAEFGTISIKGGSSSVVEQRFEHRCFRVLPPAGLDVYQDLEHVGVSQAKLGHLDCGQMFDEVCTIRSKCRLIARIIEPYQNGYVVKVNEFGRPTCEQVLEKVGDEWRPLTRPVRQRMMTQIDRCDAPLSHSLSLSLTLCLLTTSINLQPSGRRRSKVGATWHRRALSYRGSIRHACASIKAAAEASVRSVSVGKEGREEREPCTHACTPTLVSSTDVDEGNPTKISSNARRPYSPSMVSERTSSSLTVQRKPSSFVDPMISERSSSSDPGQHASPSPARRSKVASFARQSTSSMSLDHSPQMERARASSSGADLSTSPSIADRSKSPSIARAPPTADHSESPSSASQAETPTFQSSVTGKVGRATRMSSYREQVGRSSQQRSLPTVVPLQLV